MRILVLNKYCWNHPLAGGAEARLRETLKRWVQWGHEVHFLCAGFPYSPKEETINGVHIKRLKSDTNLIHITGPLMAMSLFKNFDIIYEDISPLPWFAPFYSRCNVCIIHHFNQKLYFYDHSPPLALLAYLGESVIPSFYKHTPTIVVNPLMKSALEKLGWHKVFFIPNGVDTEFYYPERKADKPMVTFVGRLEYRKGLDMLIQASHIVSREIPDIEFAIVGEGPLASHYQAIAPHNFRFFGKTTDELKRKLLQHAWVVAVPSRLEGWSLTVLEANACGVPVVANNVHGLKDSITEGVNGFLVNAFSPQEFASRLIELLNEPTRKFEKTCREYALRFSWDETAKEELKVIQSAAK